MVSPSGVAVRPVGGSGAVATKDTLLCTAVEKLAMSLPTASWIALASSPAVGSS